MKIAIASCHKRRPNESNHFEALKCHYLTASKTSENTTAPASTAATVKALKGAMRVPVIARAAAIPRSNKEDSMSHFPGRECHI